MRRSSSTTAPLVGAPRVHRVFREWLTQLGQAGDAPVEITRAG